MCGIIGYIGKRNVEEILLKGLLTLEYRGYDSAGIALLDQRGKVHVTKCVGKVQNLIDECGKRSKEDACMGIGHTRWATHGGVTTENAHPHIFGKVTLIHNGIIENYQELSVKYQLQGKLSSETDTEVVAAMLDYYYEGDPIAAIRKVVQELRGTFALGILFSDCTDKMYAIRNVSPILAGVGKNGEESFLASDVTAIAAYVSEYFVLPENALTIIEAGKITVLDSENSEIPVKLLTVDWNIDATGKNGYDYYMEKEIHEQPEVIRETILSRCKDGMPDFTVDQIPDEFLKKYEKICIIGCGTAMHAGLIAKGLLQKLVGMQTVVEVASEFIYTEPVMDDKTLAIVISQSGETIDTLEALRYARRKGAGNLSIVNVKGSTIARESEHVLYTNAGPEIAVASTKAYTTQVSALILLVLKLAYLRHTLSREEVKSYMEQLQQAPDCVKQVLEHKEAVHELASSIKNAKDAFMLGRGNDYYTCLEGSLKLKEITYIHSEAYASGELKHGTIALIAQETPVIALVTQRHVMLKEISNAIEVKARGARVVLIATQDMIFENPQQWDQIIWLPKLADELMVFPAMIVLQLLALYVSVEKGLDVDKPRNLAKVVTVE